MRFNFTVDITTIELRGKFDIPHKVVKRKDIHVYADSYDEAIIKLKLKGYKVVQDEKL